MPLTSEFSEFKIEKMKKNYLLILGLLMASFSFGQMISSFPFTEDFESQVLGPTGCGPVYTFVGNTWTNGDDAAPPSAGHGVDWTVDAAGTSSGGTGPSVDHTLGTAVGKYIYAETSCSGTGYPNINFHLVSPYLDFSALTAPKLSFWRHMLGGSGGTLHVDVAQGGFDVWTLDVIPAIANPNLDQWIEQLVDLSAYAGQDSIRIRIREVSGTSFTSDFGLDDITVFQPQPYDFAGLGFLPMSCGLGQQPVTVQFIHDGADSVYVGDSIIFNYTDGTFNFTETYYLTADLGPGDTVTYTFTGMPDFQTPGSYTMQAWTDYLADVSNANDSIWLTFTAKPIIDTYPYLENFENGNGGFEAFNTTNGAVNGTWALGTPAATIIQGAASGDNAWTTNLTGNYNNNDNSWVEGPCFDFTTIDSGAYVSMKVWWNAENSWDGSNLQTSVDGGTNWTNIGAVGTGVNWYTDNTINGAPGGSQEGWTGAGPGGWVLAKHPIPATLYGAPSVNFRITFGSDGSVSGFDGMAFDDFAIGYEDSIAVASQTDYNGCGPLALDYGTVPGFYNWSVLDTNMVEMSYGAEYTGDFTFSNLGNVDSTFYFVLDYADPSGMNPTMDTVLITLSPSPYNVLNDASICYGDSVIYSVDTNSMYTYSWNNGSTTDSATYNMTGLVEVIVTHTGSGCADTASAMLTVSTPVDLPATDHVCSGNAITLDAGVGFATYTWSTTDSTQTIDVNAAGNYVVMVVDTNGCMTSDSIDVTESSPSTSITGQVDTLCNYNSVTLNAGAGFTTYTWSTGGSAVSETIDGSSLSLGSNDVSVIVTDSYGCSAGDTITLFVDECLGISELSGLSVAIYPNPSEGVFNFEIDGFNESVQLVVTDVAGNVIMNNILNSGLGSIDLSNAANGIYFVTLQLGNDKSTIRVIKK